MTTNSVVDKQAIPSRGLNVNSGKGPKFQTLDIGHDEYVALIAADNAFWALVRKDDPEQLLGAPSLVKAYKRKAAAFAAEMQTLRFGKSPECVYFNCTERCNLNCSYCYIPSEIRRNGKHMSQQKLFSALDKLEAYFNTFMPEGRLPQIIFHGSEPMLNQDALFAAIEKYDDRFRFGVQTNGTLLKDDAIEFLTSHEVGIGLSLDGPVSKIANRARTNWAGKGVYDKVCEAITKLKGYEGFNVICTVTSENMRYLTQTVEFFHENEVPACMLNPVRCTLPGAREIKPKDHTLAKYFLAALDRTYELYQETGRKLVVANFANVLVSIVAPSARRLMCDISPCGGGRAFFAVAANGDIFPCSEFIGLSEFVGGNLFRDEIDKAMNSEPFGLVTGRKVEDIEPCRQCAIRHFCGSPCPAEAFTMNGGMKEMGAFCELYEEQVQYAFRLIADGKADAYLWDGWDKGTKTSFDASCL